MSKTVYFQSRTIIVARSNNLLFRTFTDRAKVRQGYCRIRPFLQVEIGIEMTTDKPVQEYQAPVRKLVNMSSLCVIAAIRHLRHFALFVPHGGHHDESWGNAGLNESKEKALSLQRLLPFVESQIFRNAPELRHRSCTSAPQWQ